MKVAVFSESEADEAAVRVLVEGLFGQRTKAPKIPSFRGRGWTGVLRNLPTVLKHLHYQTDTEALVVVLDSDRSKVHLQTHNQPGKADPECRLCQLRTTVAQVQKRLPSRPGFGPIKTALGLAVPAVEAWYLLGRDPHVNEAAWINGMKSGQFPYTRNGLKQKVYGTDRPSLELETQCAAKEARRIVSEEKLPNLEKLFPGGFAALANDVRSW